MGYGPPGTRRLFGHSLLFSLVLCSVAYFILPGLWPWALAVPVHLAMDGMWIYPKTLLWPTAGLDWDTSPLPEGVKAAGYLAGVRWRWKHDSAIKVEAAMEAAGLALIIWVIYQTY